MEMPPAATKRLNCPEVRIPAIDILRYLYTITIIPRSSAKQE
jgi:hypothetical protein